MTSANAATDPVDEGRSARKRRTILEAAATAFLRSGYLGTSMDEIAALASVSKQTVYKHFADKQSLFAEIVTSTVDEASDRVHSELLDLADSGDLERDLRELARRELGLVMQPQILRLRRLVIGEAGRFPELGRLFYEQGPGRTIAALAELFERLAARELLVVEDPHLAAQHFNWLVLSIPLNRAMLLGDDQPRPPPTSTGSPTRECVCSSPRTAHADRQSRGERRPRVCCGRFAAAIHSLEVRIGNAG